jgi:hypothetical protein
MSTSGKAWRLETKAWTYECAGCGRQTSVTAGTIMHHSKLPLTAWFWAAYLMATHSNGISALQLQRQLGFRSYKTAWLLCAKLRRSMLAPGRSPLAGLVEVDETEIVCRSKNDPITGGGGRSHQGNILVVGAVGFCSQILSRVRTVGLSSEGAGPASSNDTIVPIARDRGFESISLQRRVREGLIEIGIMRNAHGHFEANPVAAIPSVQILCVSYAQDLARQAHVRRLRDPKLHATTPPKAWRSDLPPLMSLGALAGELGLCYRFGPFTPHRTASLRAAPRCRDRSVASPRPVSVRFWTNCAPTPSFPTASG